MADLKSHLALQSLDSRDSNKSYEPLLGRNQGQFIGPPSWGPKILHNFGPGSLSLLVMN